jgi:hypothetical protein
VKRVYVFEDGKLREIDAWRKPWTQKVREINEQMETEIESLIPAIIEDVRRDLKGESA